MADLAGVELFLAGMVDGLIQADNLPEIKQCVTDAGDVYTQGTAIIQEFMKGDMQDIIKAVEDAMNLFKVLPDDLKACQNTTDDLNTIKQWAMNQDVTKIATNVFANLSKIQSDIATITSDFQAKKEWEAGETAADVVILALGKIASEMVDVEATVYWSPQYHNNIQLNSIYLIFNFQIDKRSI